jgi:hypothetical protein
MLGALAATVARAGMASKPGLKYLSTRYMASRPFE